MATLVAAVSAEHAQLDRLPARAHWYGSFTPEQMYELRHLGTFGDLDLVDVELSSWMEGVRAIRFVNCRYVNAS